MIMLLSIKFTKLMLALNTNCGGPCSTFHFLLIFAFTNPVIQIITIFAFVIQKSVDVFFDFAFCKFNHFSILEVLSLL